MILLAAALAQAMPLAVPADACPTICDARRLKPYFDKLARIARDRTTVRILQIGDSHTAGDQITGAWRAALQARYGNAGRGVLAPGRPYQGYLTRDVTATQTAGWTVAGIFGAAYSSANHTPIGLADFSLSTTGATVERLTIAADRGSFDRLTVCALTRPDAGTLTLDIGTDFATQYATMRLAADVPGTRCQTLESATPARAAGVTAAGPVTVTSMATERSAPGVILSNLGTVGAQLIHFARTDDRVIASESAQYRPDLLVVAFGTNEAFAPRFSGLEYGARLHAAIGRLKRLFPDVPILMLGAPDSATTVAALQTGETGPSPACPPGPLAPTIDALTAMPAPQDRRPTAALPTVQATQRRVAHEEGVAFWDWSAKMGGRCTSLAWSRSGLMRADHVHFTTAGAAEIARRLQADLDAAAAVVGAGR